MKCNTPLVHLQLFEASLSYFLLCNFGGLRLHSHHSTTGYGIKDDKPFNNMSPPLTLHATRLHDKMRFEIISSLDVRFDKYVGLRSLLIAQSDHRHILRYSIHVFCWELVITAIFFSFL